MSTDTVKLVGEAALGILARPGDPWDQIADGGWAGIGVPEEKGGQGGTLAEAVAVAHAAGTTASATPVVEVMLSGMAAAEYGRASATFSLTTGGAAEIAGRAHSLDDRAIEAVALLSAARITGALRATADLSVEYASQRSQFGRTIGSFQAIAHDLVRQAGAVALAEAAVRRATTAALAGNTAAATAARVSASTAVAQVARIAHQVHGAVGTTREHSLHRYTLSLDAWRDALGTTRWWSRRAGVHMLQDDRWWDVLGP